MERNIPQRPEKQAEDRGPAQLMGPRAETWYLALQVAWALAALTTRAPRPWEHTVGGKSHTGM